MPTVPSIYELQRDSYRYPTYWRSPNNTCIPHFHSSLEVCYILSGTLEALIDGQSVVGAPGDLLVVPSYSVHRFSSTEPNDTIMLVIPLDYIDSFRRRMADRRFTECRLSAGAHTEKIAACLRMLLEQPEHGAEAYVVRGQIYTVLGLLLEALPCEAAKRSPDHVRVQDILYYLHCHFQRAVPLQEIATAFGYSPSRISHIFNRNVGCSIPEYLNTLRARDAANQLLDGASVTTVAMEAGFESMRTFYRAFKNCFGVTPSSFLQFSQNDLHSLQQEHEISRFRQ